MGGGYRLDFPLVRGKGSRVIAQRLLLKLLDAGLLRGPLVHALEGRTWQVQAGEASGLKIAFPQNLDFVRGCTEPPMQRCVATHLRPGGVFYDIGANVGFFSLLAARRVGPGGAVYAIEPVRENADAIRRNAGLNDFAHVQVFDVAIDEAKRTGELFVTKWDGGSSLSTAAVAPADALEQRAVDVVSLDELVESRRLRPPTLVKIDVEGAELGALRGMQDTLRRHRPIVVFEVDDGDHGALIRRWKELDDFVTGLGYDVTHLENSYRNIHWFVGHSLALPRRSSSR
jgi:FkbM family methyltransferase